MEDRLDMATRQTSALRRKPAQIDLAEVDSRPSAQRPESVHRTPLVNRLRAADAPLVTVCAPAGYGKTTLLAQWAARAGRECAWVTLDQRHDDPRLLLASLARALGRPASARRSSALLARERPVLLVLDDVHLLRSRGSLALVATLAAQVPEGSTLALAGRSLRLGVARARAAGRLFELGAADLALSHREEELLLRSLGAGAELSTIRRRMEGWPAGTVLAALALDGTSADAGSGEDTFVADYFELECLAGLEASDVRFLTRTAVLDRFSAPLCDHVLRTEDAGGRLDALARASHFVVPLDRERRWFRYHTAFREYLLGELRRREPRALPGLYRRAAGWCEFVGDLAAATRYAHAAGDVDHVARLVTRNGPGSSAIGSSIGEPWLEWFDDVELLRRRAGVAVLGAWTHLLQGRPAAALRWRDAAASAAAERPEATAEDSPEGLLAVLDAAMCTNGVERMRADAQRAVEGVARLSPWRPVALLLRGVAEHLGEDGGTEETLYEAAEAAEAAGATETRIAALGQLGLLAAARGDDVRAEQLILAARLLVDEHREPGAVAAALALAASAHVCLRGEAARARADLERAEALVPLLTHALPWYAVQTNLELARVHLALADPAAAQAALDRAAVVLRRRPRLGTLVRDAASAQDEVRRLGAHRDAGQSGLTAAELRLLPLLTTHLSFREIAEQLYVSRNTVKTQAISVYRKLGVSSRSEAIARARGLGLVDQGSLRGEFTLSG
jgi:LuxR family maltose regulon positive regulatory protein